MAASCSFPSQGLFQCSRFSARQGSKLTTSCKVDQHPHLGILCFELEECQPQCLKRQASMRQGRLGLFRHRHPSRCGKYQRLSHAASPCGTKDVFGDLHEQPVGLPDLHMAKRHRSGVIEAQSARYLLFSVGLGRRVSSMARDTVTHFKCPTVLNMLPQWM